MSSKSEFREQAGPAQPGFGVATISGVNWAGLRTLYIKEVRRFMRVQLQTVWAPGITTLLYLIIFTVALARGGRTACVTCAWRRTTPLERTPRACGLRVVCVSIPPPLLTEGSVTR